MSIIHHSDISLTFHDMNLNPNNFEYVKPGKRRRSNQMLLSEKFYGCEAFCFIGKGSYELIHKTYPQNLDDIINARPDTFNPLREPMEFNGDDVIRVAMKRDNDCEEHKAEQYKKALSGHMYSVILNYRFNILLDYPGKSLYIFSDDFRGVFHYRDKSR